MKPKIATTIISFLLFLSILSSCAPNVHKPLESLAKEQISTTDAYLIIEQQEINANIDQSNVTAAMGGGLIAALIDASINNSRAKEAEKLMKPIRDSLIDFQFDKYLMEQLQKQMSSVEWMNLKSLQLKKDFSEESISGFFKDSSASVVLYVQTNYYLTPDFKDLKVLSKVYMLPNNEELRKFRDVSSDDQLQNSILENAIYKNIFEFSDTSDSEIQTKESAISYWSDNNAINTRNCLEKGSFETAKMIVLDLNSDNATAGNVKEQKTFSNEYVSGTVLNEDGERILVRDNSGKLYSLMNSK
jgi:hypothetical protein